MLRLSEETLLLGPPFLTFPLACYLWDSRLNTLTIVYLSSDQSTFSAKSTSSVKAQGPIYNFGPLSLQAPFEVCFELYNSILGDLEYAKTALTTHDYFSVKVASDSCMIDTENCRDELTSNAPPFLQENNEMRYICVD